MSSFKINLCSYHILYKEFTSHNSFTSASDTEIYVNDSYVICIIYNNFILLNNYIYINMNKYI